MSLPAPTIPPLARTLTASQAAWRLNISAKALRLYEQHGLLHPDRTSVGWRAYGAVEMVRARQIVEYRRLGLSLAQIARVLDGDPSDLGPALSAHQTDLERQAEDLANRIGRLSRLRHDIERGQPPEPDVLSRLIGHAPGLEIAFALPWPWGGEPFGLIDIRPLTYIVGPLGSGKTRLALEIARHTPGAMFVGLDRLEESSSAMRERLAADPALVSRVEVALDRMAEDGAERSDALVALIARLETEGPTILVIDMVEQSLDQATQEALRVHLRHRRTDKRPLFLMTRSSIILDLAATGMDETVILCPANHSPPTIVAPIPGSAGYEAVATCLATPEVRARTAGTVALRPISDS